MKCIRKKNDLWFLKTIFIYWSCVWSRVNVINFLALCGIKFKYRDQPFISLCCCSNFHTSWGSTYWTLLCSKQKTLWKVKWLETISLLFVRVELLPLCQKNISAIHYSFKVKEALHIFFFTIKLLILHASNNPIKFVWSTFTKAFIQSNFNSSLYGAPILCADFIYAGGRMFLQLKAWLYGNNLCILHLYRLIQCWCTRLHGKIGASFLFWKKDRGLVDGCRSWRRSKPQLLLSQVQIKLRLFKGAASPGDEELCWSSGQKTGKTVKAERLMVMVSFYRIYFIFLSLRCSSCGHNEFFPRPCLQSVDI